MAGRDPLLVWYTQEERVLSVVELYELLCKARAGTLETRVRPRLRPGPKPPTRPPKPRRPSRVSGPVANPPPSVDPAAALACAAFTAYRYGPRHPGGARDKPVR